MERGGRALVMASKADRLTPWKSALELAQWGAQLSEVPGSHYRAFDSWDLINRFLGKKPKLASG